MSRIGKRLADVVAIVIAAAIVWFAHENFPEYFVGVAIGTVILLGGWFARYIQYAEPREPEPDLPPLSNNYGTADYAVQKTGMPAGLTSFSGVFFGKSSTPAMNGFSPSKNPGAALCSAPENHTLIVARTRTGKGTRVIIPTLLRYGKGSMIVIDPKGENAAVTARTRASMSGAKVHIINPWGILDQNFRRLGFEPATFNPLDILDRSDPNVVANAMSLAASISPSKGEKDAFWRESAAHIIAAVLLWLTDQEGLPLPGQSPEKKTLSRLSEILSQSPRDFSQKYLAAMSVSEAFGGAIRKLSSRFIGMPDVTYGGIMSNVAQTTAFLIDPLVLAATETSSFPMEDLIRARTTLYLVIPPEQMPIQRTWLRLVIAAALQTIRRKRSPEAPRCMFLLDEFPALGRMEDMPSDIAVMSGFGVDFVLVVQGLDQLKDVYGDAHGAILNNCAYKWFCNVSDYQGAEYLSKTLGKKTVRTISKGENEGTTKGASRPMEREGKSTSYGEVGRDLLQPDEVLNLGRETAILIAPGSLPHYLQPVDYWNLPEAFSMFEQSCPHLFWDPPLQYDANPTVPGSKGSGSVSAASRAKAPSAAASNYDPTLYAPKTAQSQAAEKAVVDTSASKPIDLNLYSPLNPARSKSSSPPAPKKSEGDGDT